MLSNQDKRLTKLEQQAANTMTEDLEWKWREFVYRDLPDDELRHIINAGEKAGDDVRLMDNPAWREANMTAEESAALAR